MSDGKIILLHLIDGLIKKIYLSKMSFFPESYTHDKSKIEVEVNLSNYLIMQQNMT